MIKQNKLVFKKLLRILEGSEKKEREREREIWRRRWGEGMEFEGQLPHIFVFHSLQKDQLAPNVLSMVRASNELALMVPGEILEETTTHGRAKVISSFIKV